MRVIRFSSGALPLAIVGLFGACAGARQQHPPPDPPSVDVPPSGDTDTTADSPEPSADPSAGTDAGEGLLCGVQHCRDDTPFCAQDDSAAGGWRCVAKDDPNAMFKMQCLTKDDCAAQQQCCAGMTTRCVADGECEGGDTPLIACATEADCPQSWYGMPVLGCKPSDHGMPGLKLCQVR